MLMYKFLNKRAPMTTAEVSNENWKTVQVKTFTKWINNKLSSFGYDTIEDVFEDCCDGTALINLLQGITGMDIKHNKVAATRYKKLENNQFLIEFLERNNIQVVNIRPSDLADGNHKLLLGLIWIIILRFGITGLGEENINAKKALLAWCNAVTASYHNVDIKDFSSSWRDGLAFNAIIHHFRPDLTGNYESLKSNNALYNIKKAFNTAEKDLGIPQLLDPEDITDAVRPDERSIFTYISQYYNKFSSLEREMAVKKRASHFLKRFNWSIKARGEYEKIASQLLLMQDSFESDKQELGALLSAFLTKLTKRQEMAQILNKMFLDLKSLYSNIESTHDIYKIKKYKPPENLRIEILDKGVYEAGLRSFSDSKVLAETVSFQLRKDIPDHVETIERIKKLFEHSGDISGQAQDIKNEVIDKDCTPFRDLLDPVGTAKSKIAYLEQIAEAIKSRNLAYSNAISLFRKYDTSNKNRIHLNDMVKCLKSLNCHLSKDLEKNVLEGTQNIFTFEEYLNAIKYLRTDDAGATQLQQDIEGLSSNGTVMPCMLNLSAEDIELLLDKSGAIDLDKVINGLDV